ncbi:MAG: hypothetical protein IKK33_09475 [Lachnospiraceae bacterium]|nr:hypothetical protein [Lachnospiraceae bacterium]
MEKKTIKQQFHLEYDTSEELFPLQEWYNELLDKEVGELTVFDVLRMLRQNVLPEVALLSAVKWVLEDIYVGDAYDGQLLEALTRVEDRLLKPYVKVLQELLQEAEVLIEDHDWSYEGEQEEFGEVMKQLSQKLTKLQDNT